MCGRPERAGDSPTPASRSVPARPGNSSRERVDLDEVRLHSRRARPGSACGVPSLGEALRALVVDRRAARRCGRARRGRPRRPRRPAASRHRRGTSAANATSISSCRPGQHAPSGQPSPFERQSGRCRPASRSRGRHAECDSGIQQPRAVHVDADARAARAVRRRRRARRAARRARRRTLWVFSSTTTAGFWSDASSTSSSPHPPGRR